MVKIKTLRPIMVKGEILPENTTIDVSEQDAKDFCDTKFDAPSTNLGHQPSLFKGSISRAVRV